LYFLINGASLSRHNLRAASNHCLKELAHSH
jgi:hypothetical protein